MRNYCFKRRRAKRTASDQNICISYKLVQQNLASFIYFIAAFAASLIDGSTIPKLDRSTKRHFVHAVIHSSCTLIHYHLQNVGGTARAIAKSSMLPTRRNFANNYNCTNRINLSGSSRCCESSANLSVIIFHYRSSFGGVDNSDSSTLGSREVGNIKYNIQTHLKFTVHLKQSFHCSRDLVAEEVLSSIHPVKTRTFFTSRSTIIRRSCDQ